MKEYIKYYYQLAVLNLHFVHGKYYFSDGKNKYLLEPVDFYEDTLEEIYQNYLSFLSTSKNFHEIVKSVYQTVSVIIEKKRYVLLKMSSVPDQSIQIFDLKKEWGILFYPQKKNSVTKIPWSHLWEQKIDYFEELFVSGKNDFSIQPDLFFYFIGMGEVAISYYRETLRTFSSYQELPLVPSHRRVSSSMSFVEYYDPVSIIFDYRIRDISEFMKNSFWQSSYDLSSFESFLNQVQFQKIEAQLFLSRLLFPSFYFDYLETEKNQNEFYDRVEEYQSFLSFIYQYLYDRYGVDEIFWLKKKM